MERKKVKNLQPKKDLHKPYQQPQKRLNKNIFFDLAALTVIILLGIIIYSNSFYCSFQLDDRSGIVENMIIRNMADVKALWNQSQTRFVPYYSFAVNYHFGKLNVWGYHLLNLVIHLINACLVYWLTSLIFSSPAIKDHSISKDKKVIAFFTALLFVSHPLATQSVTYIVQRMASMAAMFYLLSITLYIKARLTNKNKAITEYNEKFGPSILPSFHPSLYFKYLLFVGSAISAVLALFSKENAFTLPFAILLVELFFIRTKKLSINLEDYRVILVIAASLLFILFVLFKFSFSIFNQLPPDENNNFITITSSNYLLTQFSVIAKYIRLLFLPVNQNLDHDIPVSNNFFELRTLISFLFLLSLFILAIFLFKKNRIISFGIFWFFLTLSIESGIIPISDVIFEHRTYLPSLGFFLILSSGIFLLGGDKYKNIAISFWAIIILSNSYLAYQRNKVWKNEFTMWNDVVSKSPGKSRGFNNIGKFLLDKNKFEDALSNFNKAIELSPRFAKAYCNRGTVFENEKKNQPALADYNKAIELDPKYFTSYNNRGNIFKAENRFDQALEDYNKAILINPNYFYTYNNRGSVYVAVKKYAEGIKDLNKAIELKPDCAEAYANRGVAELNLGKTESACLDFKKAIELGFQQVVEPYNQYCH